MQTIYYYCVKTLNCSKYWTIYFFQILLPLMIIIVYIDRHGDMLFLDSVKNDEYETGGKSSAEELKEDEIDVFLSKQDGLIHRKKDPHM